MAWPKKAVKLDHKVLAMVWMRREASVFRSTITGLLASLEPLWEQNRLQERLQN
jgi:hypothetical protein